MSHKQAEWETEKKVYRLKNPIYWENDELVEQLEFRAPKGKDLIGLNFQADPLGDVMKLAGLLNHVSPTIIKELSVRDVMAINEVVGDFLDISLETGSSL